MCWQSAKHFVRKFRQIKLILWKNHFHEKIKDISKTNTFWRNSFTSLHFIITDIRAKFARPTHILHITFLYTLDVLTSYAFSSAIPEKRWKYSNNLLFLATFLFLSSCLFIIVFEFWFYWVGLRSNKIWTWSRKIFNGFPMIQVLNLI